MSEQDPNSSVEPPIPGAGEPGEGAPTPAGAAPSGGEPEGQPPAPPPDPDWAGVPENVRNAVQKRIDAVISKNKELEDRLAGLSPSPEAPAGGGGEEENPAVAYAEWEKTALNGDPKAIALFRGFRDIIDQAVVAYVDSKVAPLDRGFQDSAAEAFYRANPAAQTKKREIEAEMKAVPGLTRDKAWRIVNYGAPPPARPPKAPPPGQRPGAPGAPSAPADLPRGKGIGAIVQAVADKKGF